jgi:vitamin B12 transporter
MKKTLIVIILLTAFTITKAQTKISGTVKDNRNQPLAGANITIKDSYDGTTSDSLGRFSFTTTEQGDKIIEVSLLSYKTFEKPLKLDGTAQRLDVILKEKPNELTAVTVTAGAFEAGDRKKTTILNSIDIVTTASANADITGALKTLPGTQQVGESEGLFVRGGTATESKIFIDGTQVNNFFYSSTPGIASRGRFNPFLFKGTVFSTGGYSALYGQALSSALILETIDLPDQSSASVGASFFFGGGGFQYLDKKKRYSWGANYNYTNLELAFKIIKQKQDFYKSPVFHEGDANFRIKTSKTGMIKYYFYLSSGKLGFRINDIDTPNLKSAFGLDNINMYHNLSWKERIGKGWKLSAGISFSTNRDKINNELQNEAGQKQVIGTPAYLLFKNNNLETKGNFLQARVVLEKKLPGINALRFGLENSYSNERAAFTLYNGTTFSDTVKQNTLAGFAETDIYLTNYLAAKIGLRAEHSDALNKNNLAPRLSLAYKFTNQAQVSLAYGIFYQNPERRYLPTPYTIGFSKATHYIAQYQRINNIYSFRAEVFYKKYDRLYKTGSNGFGKEVAINTNGNGDAKGLEIFWRDKKTIKNMDYWISYSYLDTKRDFLNYPSLLEPSFATKHTASFVVKKFVLKWKTGFNAAYNFATGRPYYNLQYNSGLNKYVVADKGTTINYNNLSFSLNYLPYLGNTKSKKFMVVVLSLSNVLGQNQVYTYNYSTDGKRKEAVTPPSRRFFFVGVFINFGVDRTEDAINSNL